VVVVGAGVVGLAAGRALARAGRDVLVLEAADRIGTGVSSRSSEVVHAGIYYPPGSLKAATCSRGRDLLYDYCRANRVPHRRTGKLLVATSREQMASLEAVGDNARRCGVSDLRWLSASEARELEPEVHCVAALWSPSSGIVDTHALMAELEADLERAAGIVVVGAEARRIVADGQSVRIDVDGDWIEADQVVISAGLGALGLARTCLPASALPSPPSHFAKGTYYALTGREPPFRRLVYPIPEGAGLGIHATVDLQGQVRFGPDVQWTTRIELSADDAQRERFETAVRRYWPGLPDGALAPTYAGIRPKIVGPLEPSADFRVLGRAEHGVRGVTALLGIESPGLTACLALAELVVDTVCVEG